MHADSSSSVTSPLTLVGLGMGYALSLLGMGLAFWGFGIWTGLSASVEHLLTDWLTHPDLHAGRFHLPAAPHTLLGSLGLLISVVALGVSLWFAERQAQRGRLV